MAKNFDEILANVQLGNGGHANKGDLAVTDTINEEIGSLSVDAETRKIMVPAGFDTTIAVTNDYNSNEITITIPAHLDGHDITSCQRKVMKWYNEKSKERGASELFVEQKEDTLQLKWIIPPEATTAAGVLQFALCFCDLDINDRVLYKWNSLVNKDFQVAQGLDEISISGAPLSQIITLDLYTRQFTLPGEFNSTIAYVGDNASSILTFRVDRFLRGIDFWDGEIIVKSAYTGEEETYESHVPKYVLLEDLGGNTQDDLMQFEWEVPSVLTTKEGPIEIIVSLKTLKR